jgi:hypothetical protein
MTVYRLTEGLALVEATQGIMKSSACFDEILKEEKRLLSRQTSVLDIFELSSGTCTTGHWR